MFYYTTVHDAMIQKSYFIILLNLNPFSLLSIEISQIEVESQDKIKIVKITWFKVQIIDFTNQQFQGISLDIYSNTKRGFFLKNSCKIILFK